nr:hypothetical protein [Tanacetum cinerariifolium]
DVDGDIPRGKSLELSPLNQDFTCSLFYNTLSAHSIFGLFILAIIMTNLAKLEFLALDITVKNYLSWVLDAEIHLDANGIGNTIKEGNETIVQDKTKIMIFYAIILMRL